MITPLTERCIVAVFSAFASEINPVFPLLTGSRGQGRRRLMSEIAYSAGREHFNLDLTGHSHVSSLPLVESALDRATAVMLSAAGCGLWASLSGLEAMSDQSLAVLATSVSVLHNAVVAGLDTMSFHGLNIRFPVSVHQNMPKLILMYAPTSKDLNKSNPLMASASLRKQFRPISMSFPEFKLLISSLFEVYQYPQANMLVFRLANFAQFLAQQSQVAEHMMMTKLVRIVRDAAPLLVMKKIMEYQRVAVYLIKAFFKAIPKLWKQHWNVPQLKLACTTFLSLSFEANFEASDVTLFPKSLAQSSIHLAYDNTINSISNFLEVSFSYIYGDQIAKRNVSVTKSAATAATIDAIPSRGYSAVVGSYNPHTLIVTGPSRCGKSRAISQAVRQSNGRIVPSDMCYEGKSGSDFHFFPHLMSSHLRLDDANSSTLGSHALSIMKQTILNEIVKVPLSTERSTDQRGTLAISSDPELFVFVMDLPSSDNISEYIPVWERAAGSNPITTIAPLPLKNDSIQISSRVRVIWECPELMQICPAVAAGTPIVHIRDYLYDWKTEFESVIIDRCSRYV